MVGGVFPNSWLFFFPSFLFLLTVAVLPSRWELVGSVSHCRAGAGVAVCSSHVSQIRDVGQGSSNVANCMWPLPRWRPPGRLACTSTWPESARAAGEQSESERAGISSGLTLSLHTVQAERPPSPADMLEVVSRHNQTFYSFLSWIFFLFWIFFCLPMSDVLFCTVLSLDLQLCCSLDSGVSWRENGCRAPVSLHMCSPVTVLDMKKRFIYFKTFQSSLKAVQVSLRYHESIWDKTADTFNLTAQPCVSVRVKKFTDVSRRIISQQFYLASLFCSPVCVWTIIYGWWTAKHKKMKIIMARPVGAKCGDKSAESWLASFTLLATDTSDPSNTRQQLESPQHPSFHNRGGRG